MYKNKDLGKHGINLTDYDEYGEYDCYWTTGYEEELNYIIKDYEHYLVFAFNCRWNGASGYNITDNKLDAFVRDYDVTQYLKRVTKGNKACLLREYHHDVPMGHDVVIVGLTDEEYQKLNTFDFEKVEKFATEFKMKLQK